MAPQQHLMNEIVSKFLFRGAAAADVNIDSSWEIAISDLTLSHRIGIGSFAEVYQGVWRGVPVAVKVLLPSPCGEKEVCLIQKETFFLYL